MKKIVSIITVIFGVLFGPLPLVSAATVYTENWGSPNATVQTANTLGLVGWTVIANRQGGVGPYYGIYAGTGANDPALGLGLPVNTVYLTGLSGTSTNQLGGPAMLYTRSGDGSGSAGNTAFADINPTLFTNLTFNVEIRVDGGNCSNYFAVQVGGSWYVCTNNPFPSVNAGTYPVFTNWSMVYTNPANAWYGLTQGATSVTVGGPATPSFSSPITGIGIVEFTNTVPGGNNGYNYNEIVINQGPGDFPSGKPVLASAAVTPQNVYVGGGASFLPSFSGAPTLAYSWKTNGVSVVGARFLGANTTSLTITNASLNDGLWNWSVVVTNFFDKATNNNLALNVIVPPAGLLYAETFPYVGPNGNLPITGVGWLSSVGGNTGAGIYADPPGSGSGDVFSYSPDATTNVYYTTSTNDTGLSGLPFVPINPASYPAITLQAGFVPGNGPGQVSGAVTVYWAVAMNGIWYASKQPVPVALSALSPYQNYQLGFSPAATNWNNLTITGTGGVIGSQAAGALTGNITGAGLVIAHNDASGSDMNFQNFEILTNQFVGTAPDIGITFPLSVGVAAGGGASFGVAATGTQPFGYYWTTNGVPFQDGGRITGATTATLNIANLTTNDDNLTIVAWVTNSAGSVNSSAFVTTLTVTNPPVGLIYSEQFPFVGPVTNIYAISSIGWVEAVPGVPNALFQTSVLTSEGAVFAYLGSPGTTVYYATTATDTNQSGLPFPNIKLSSYPSLNFSVDIAPTTNALNVTAFFAVQLAQLGGTNWYVTANPLPVPAVDSATYATYTLAFNPTAANWKNLTVTASGGLIGSTAVSNLGGVMMGAGLVFVTVGTGGNFNIDNFQITGTGLGGINVGPLTGGNINLSWVGNPAVNLQSSTNLSSSLYWQDVSSTLGLYSKSVTATGPQKFFRLVQH